VSLHVPQGRPLSPLSLPYAHQSEPQGSPQARVRPAGLA
jgi:hypothetical protein